MTDSLLASYEAVPYNSRPVASCEIGALESIALLYGVTAPRADRARVLELGCASGGNLIPMAYRYPDATFVGVDLTPGQVAAGNAEVSALGLTNLTLIAMSIADITDAFGTFDYILCHGVYSWVPPEVQEAILRISSRNLAPDGLAYVSYNTLPGWHVRGMVREMVMYHDDHTLSPKARVERAKQFVRLLGDVGGTKATPHRLSIMEEVTNLDAADDSYFLHEQLEPFNSPVYFSEFVRRAREAGLEYVCEAKLADPAASPAAWARREAGDDPVRTQQYGDFATGRTFRRSVLCHPGVAIRPEPDVNEVRNLYASLHAAEVTPNEEDRAKGDDVESFSMPSGVRMTTNNPLVLAAFHALVPVAPAAMAFDELLQRINERLDAADPPGVPPRAERAGALAQTLLQCGVSGFVELHARPMPFTSVVSERPVASRLAIAKAASSPVVPNLRHAMVELSDVERVILGGLDGTRDRLQLAQSVIDGVDAGRLQSGAPLPARDILAELVDGALSRLADAALLEA